jgi:hydroxypyruvate isomerase
MPRFAANLSMLFTERPLIERFAAAAAAGFPTVEVQVPYEVPASDVKAELDRNGLVMLGLNTARGQPGEFGLAAVPGREAEFAELVRQALDYAAAIGATAVHCLAGVVPPEKRPAADATFVANLARAADAAAARNVTLLIEPINTRDRPDYFLTRVEHAADVIARVGRPNVKIQFDCYHVQIMQGDLIKRIERHLPLIGHVQIAAVPSRAEPDEGEIDYPAVCAALDAMGYRGWIAAEYQPRGLTEDGLAWMRRYASAPKRR